MGVERIIINLHSETTVAADFYGIGKSIFLADGKEHFACGCFFGKGHAFYGHRAEFILALRLVLLGKYRVAFVACNAFLIRSTSLRLYCTVGLCLSEWSSDIRHYSHTPIKLFTLFHTLVVFAYSVRLGTFF